MNHPGTALQTLTDKLVARKEGAIGWIIFNNPARHNAVSLEMWQSLPLVLDAYASDPEVRVIVLKGEGEKAFVAGADISQFKEKRSSPEAVAHYNATADGAAEVLRGCTKPTIAMIRGYCIGGGTGIAVSCDIRIAADDARFGVPAAKLGLGYRFAGIRHLADVVGPSFTAEIFYTGRQFDAQEALQMGLVNRLVPVEALERRTHKLADKISANAAHHRLGQARVARIREGPRRARSRALSEDGRGLFTSQDYVEGQTAFMEKRKP